MLSGDARSLSWVMTRNSCCKACSVQGVGLLWEPTFQVYLLTTAAFRVVSLAVLRDDSIREASTGAADSHESVCARSLYRQIYINVCVYR